MAWRRCILACLCFFLLGYSGIPEAKTGSKLLRSSLPLPPEVSGLTEVKVAILRHQKKITLTIPFAYTISGAFSGAWLDGGDRLPDSVVRPAENGFRVGEALYVSDRLIIRPQGRFLKINGRDYRGHVEIKKEKDGTLLVINRLPMEDYLKGVLPGEVNHRWSMEALKAQAVASRTYALFKLLDKRNESFALSSDILSQVYIGKTAEKQETTRAVENTHGEILLFRGEIFPAFFHACCGGETTRAENVWHIRPNPVLRGTACPYCSGTKYYRWKASLSFHEIEKNLHSHGYTMGRISEIIFGDDDATGRIRQVQIHHEKGVLNLPASDFRLLAGGGKMKSTKTSAEIHGDKVLFQGYGWGHGVGFCQWGAKVQSDQGKRYKEILEFYFPGSTIKKLY